MGFSQDRVQQRLVPGSSTIQFLWVGGGGAARGDLQGSRAGQNSSANLEQIVDIPARRGLPGFLPGQGSSPPPSRLHDRADEDFAGVLRTFPPFEKKVRRNCSPRRAHPRGELMRIGIGIPWTLLGCPCRSPGQVKNTLGARGQGLGIP